MSKLLVADTNVILRNIESLQEYNVVLLSHVLIELDRHKSSSNKELAYKARKATRYIKENRDKFTFDSKVYDGSLLGEGYTNKYEDYNIVQACLINEYGIITEDVLLSYVAEGFGIEVVELNDDSGDSEDYNGYKEVYMLPDQVKDVYQNLNLNQWDLLINEYLLIRDEVVGDLIDALKWNGDCLVGINAKGFNSMNLGKFKPKDHYQQCALDSLSSNQVTMIKGRAGTGKSLISLSYAWSQVEREKYNKLIIFCNPVNAGKTSSKLGFYKGDKDSKLIDGNLGAILSSKFGDKSQVDALILSGRLVLYPFADIRGVDVQDAIVWVVEAENLDVSLLKIAVQRIAESSKLIIDGDYKQVDSDLFEGLNNGMRRMTEVFKGRDMYGEVELQNVYRSRIAEIADEM